MNGKTGGNRCPRRAAALTAVAAVVALTACGGSPSSSGGSASPQSATYQAELAFAQCMQTHGVPDFPDPAANGPIIDTKDIPSAATAAGRSALDAAIAKCGALYSGEMGVTRQR